MAEDSQILITRNDGKHRYEARLAGEADDAVVGFGEYQLTDELVVFTHTEVADHCEGLGVGLALVRFALDDVAADGRRRVLPLCPFVKDWIGRHRDYVALVYGAPPSTARD